MPQKVQRAYVPPVQQLRAGHRRLGSCPTCGDGTAMVKDGCTREEGAMPCVALADTQPLTVSGQVLDEDKKLGLDARRRGRSALRKMKDPREGGRGGPSRWAARNSGWTGAFPALSTPVRFLPAQTLLIKSWGVSKPSLSPVR